VKVCHCTIVDVRRTVTLFEYLLIQNQTVHSPTHSPMTRTIDPSSPMAQSIHACVCVCDCYFCKFLTNQLRSWNWLYFQKANKQMLLSELFTYDRIHFSLKRCLSNQWGENPWNHPFPLGATGPTSITRMPKPTILTIPNDSSIGSCSCSQLRTYATKFPLVTWGCPKFIPKIVPSPSITTHASTDPTHHRKQHQDRLSHFATIHFPDRPTDGLGEKPVARVLTLYW